MRDWDDKAPTEGRPSEEEVYFLKYTSVKELLSKIYERTPTNQKEKTENEPLK